MTGAASRRQGSGEWPRWGGAAPPRWIRMIPLVLLFGIAVLNAATASVQLGLLLAAIPPLAALWYGPMATAVYGLATVVLLVVPGVQSDELVQAEILVVAAVAATSPFFAWIRTRREHQLVSVLTIAEVAQLAVLPPLPERVGHVRCAGIYRAALRGTLVGGDLFEVRRGPHGVRVLVGDVQGHGLTAVDTVSALLGAFREAVLDVPDLVGVAARLDRRLVVDAADARDEGDARDAVSTGIAREPEERTRDEQPIGEGELLATAVFLEFPTDSSEVRVVSRGHPPPLLLRGDGFTELPVDPGTPLGIDIGDTAPPQMLTMALDTGDRLLVHTDGLTEARNSAGDFYPLRQRLPVLTGVTPGDVPARVTDGASKDLVALVNALWWDVSRFAGEIRDDVAILAFAPNVSQDG